MERVEGPEGSRPRRPSLGRASGPRPHSGTLTFFRGCHFIIFVQPICGTSRCWLGAGGRCRAAATPSHAACLPPPNSFPYSPRRERAQRVQSFRLQFSEVSPNQEHAPHGARKSQQQPEYSSQSGAFSPRASARKRSLQQGVSKPTQRPSLREEPEDASRCRNPVGFLPSKPLLTNSPLLKKRLDKQSNPHAQPGAIPKILSVFLVCKI